MLKSDIGDTPLNFIKRFFTGMKQDSPISDPVEVKSAPSEQNVTSTSTTAIPEPAKANGNFSDEPAPPRTVLHAPALKDSLFPESSEDILINAQPSQTGDQCLFTVNRVLINIAPGTLTALKVLQSLPLRKLFSRWMMLRPYWFASRQ